MVSLRRQDGKIIIKNGKAGTEQGCCCEIACPEECPDLTGCNLVAVLNYPGSPVEVVNSPFSLVDRIYPDCRLYFEIPDVPIEHGGDIEAIVIVGYDQECKPVVSELIIDRTVDHPGNDQSCDDGETQCVEVLVSLVCN
jgi:hypothetical protein